MGKGKDGKSKGFVSAGVHRNVAKSTLKAMRTEKTEAEKMIDKQHAWLKGHNPWVTIANPNKNETNKSFIKVRMNDLMRGSAKDVEKRMFIIK